MAKSFTAQVSDWVNRSEEKMRTIMQASVQDVMSAAQEPGVSLARGAATVTQGAVPVDTGFLRNSLISGLNGAFGPESPDSYILTIAGMDLGDTARFAWTAPYAAAIEYGHGTYPGAHFVGLNAARWEEIVAANAQRLK